MNADSYMLFNKSSGRKIIERIRLADSYWKKLKGLMFSGRHDYALIFDFGGESRIKASIHMLFVFHSIDLVYLSKEKKVVDLVEGIRPFTLNYTPKKNARYLIELPEGSIKKNRIELNNEIEWKD